MYSSSENPTVIKSKRGRKALAVSEGYIDVTGKTHIMTARRLNPPASKKKSTKPTISKSAKQCNNYCAKCEKNDEYVDILNDRIGKQEIKIKLFFKSNVNVNVKVIQAILELRQKLNFVVVKLEDGTQFDFPVPTLQEIRDKFFFRKTKSPPNKFFIFRTTFQSA